MTKLHVALAGAWVDCEWERDALLLRIIHIVGEDAPWMRVVVEDALRELAPVAPVSDVACDDTTRDDKLRDDTGPRGDNTQLEGIATNDVGPEPIDDKPSASSDDESSASVGDAGPIDVEGIATCGVGFSRDETERDWIVELLTPYEELDDKLDEPIDRQTQIADWLLRQEAFTDAARFGARTRRPWIEPPEMRDSAWHVPAVPTHGELAQWFGISHERLAILADRRQLSRSSRDPRARHYRYTWIAKRTGGHRLIEAPKPMLRTIQRYVLDEILAAIPPHAAAHGFRTGHSVRTFAAPHVGHEVVLRVDLRAFFTSINAARVAAVFRAAGYPRPIAATLAALCTHATPRDVIASAPSIADRELLSRHLPQGAPTSGALANLVAYRFDVRVAALAASLDAHYTRYADDLALSGSRALARAMPTIVARLGAIAIEEGFALNFRKTRVMRASTRQRLTGLVVNQRLAIARSDLEALRAILHNCVRFGPDSQNRAGLPDFRAHLQGRVSWVTSIDPRKGARLAAQLAQINW